MKFFQTLIVFVMLFAGTAALSGCNTVEGVGKDVAAGGQALQKSAHRSQ